MILELKGVNKSFEQPDSGTIDVLNDINLSIDNGQTCAITGHSGSGKTTLLSLIAGLDLPNSGEILLDGENLCHMKENKLAKYRAANIGIIFQQFHLMPHLSAKENIGLPLEILKQSDIDKRVEDMLDKVGLSHRCHHLPAQLSGGECQRVAIARALITRPKLLLADEPTGNLDSSTGVKIASLLFELVEHENKAMILVTHNQELAARCEVARELHQGNLQ